MMYTSCLTQNLHQYIRQISPYMMKSPTNNGYIDDPNIKELDLHMALPWYLCSQSSYRLIWTDCPLFPLSAVNRNFTYNLNGYLPNFAILFLFSKSSFWYGFYLKNENEKFLFYLKYKENMCGSWFASQFTPPIPPPTNQPNAEIWHINVSVPKTKRWIIQIKNFHFCYQKNKTKQNKT